MRGLVEKLVMFSVTSVSGVGGIAGYNYVAGEEGALTIDDLANLVDWNNIAQVVTTALGTN